MREALPAQVPVKIFLIAGEESGDRLGAALIRALRKQAGEAIVLQGIGGAAMQREGVNSLFPIDALSIVGFASIPRKLPMIFRRIREAVQAVLAARPDVLVIIDSPDFTHRVARRVRKADPSIPIVDYVSPSVWAWRPGRARKMRAYIDHVLALLPFEPESHAKLGGPPCTYVGHPLIEEIAQLRPSQAEAQRRLAPPPVLLVLPGSRRTEIRYLLSIFAETIARLRAAAGEPMEIVIPTLPHLVSEIAQQTRNWPQPPRLVTETHDKRAAFRIARAALAKSGTVTLELALSGVPTVAAYKVSAIEAMIARRVIRVPSVILANLVIGENVVPEFLQEDCTPEKLSQALLPLLSDTPERARQIEAFRRLDAIMAIGKAEPAQRAADIVLGLRRKAV